MTAETVAAPSVREQTRQLAAGWSTAPWWGLTSNKQQATTWTPPTTKKFACAFSGDNRPLDRGSRGVPDAASVIKRESEKKTSVCLSSEQARALTWGRRQLEGNVVTTNQLLPQVPRDPMPPATIKLLLIGLWQGEWYYLCGPGKRTRKFDALTQIVSGPHHHTSQSYIWSRYQRQQYGSWLPTLS